MAFFNSTLNINYVNKFIQHWKLRFGKIRPEKRNTLAVLWQSREICISLSSCAEVDLVLLLFLDSEDGSIYKDIRKTYVKILNWPTNTRINPSVSECYLWKLESQNHL